MTFRINDRIGGIGRNLYKFVPDIRNKLESNWDDPDDETAQFN